MLDLIDDSMLAQLTRVAHFVQRWTGKTCYFLSRWCSMFTLAGVFINMLDYFLPDLLVEKTWWMLVPLSGVWSLTIVAQIYRVTQAEEAWHNNPTVIPREVIFSHTELAWLRVPMLLIATALFIPSFVHDLYQPNVLMEVLNDVVLNTFIFAIYFEAVCPLPPAEGKVAEWFKGLRAMFRQPVTTGG